LSVIDGEGEKLKNNNKHANLEMKRKREKRWIGFGNERKCARHL